MAYKLGFLLSLFYVVQILAYSGDLAALQSLHSLLDACAITVAHQIALEGSITPAIVSFVQKDAKATIVQLSEGTPQVGEILEFQISRSYLPLILADSSMTVAVRRSAVIGYLD